jgi:hypothetical protein
MAVAGLDPGIKPAIQGKHAQLIASIDAARASPHLNFSRHARTCCGHPRLIRSRAKIVFTEKEKGRRGCPQQVRA